MNISQIKNKILSGKEGEVIGKCFFCSKELDGMFWCFGCHHFICEDCDNKTDSPIGKHTVENHRKGG